MKYLDSVYSSQKDNTRFIKIYMESHSKFDPKSFEKRMQNFEFPSQLSLDNCKKYGLLEGQITLFYKLGTPENAVTAILQHLRKNIQLMNANELGGWLKRCDDLQKAITLDTAFVEVSSYK